MADLIWFNEPEEMARLAHYQWIGLDDHFEVRGSPERAEWARNRAFPGIHKPGAEYIMLMCPPDEPRPLPFFHLMDSPHPLRQVYPRVGEWYVAPQYLELICERKDA